MFISFLCKQSGKKLSTKEGIGGSKTHRRELERPWENPEKNPPDGHQGGHEKQAFLDEC